MASEKEITEVMELLQSAYPSNKSNAKLLDIWVRKFAETPAAILARAAELHIETCKFFPALAEIWELCQNKAERQVSEEERQANVADIQSAEFAWQDTYLPLYARFRALEEAYWHNHEFDCEAWEMLVGDFDRAGCEQTAHATRGRMAEFQAEIELESIPAEMAVTV